MKFMTSRETQECHAGYEIFREGILGGKIRSCLVIAIMGSVL